jgi:hypothetical protein
MAITRVLQELQNILSYCGLGFLVVYGFQTAFAYPCATVAVRHPWLGYLMLVSAFAVANRLRVVRKPGS